MRSAARSSSLVLNVAPIRFSSDTVVVGRLEYGGEEAYAALRESHRDTHVFRFDQRDGKVANVALAPDMQPLGQAATEPVEDNLSILGKAVQHSLLRWLARRFTIIHRVRPVSFLGGGGTITPSLTRDPGVRTTASRRS